MARLKFCGVSGRFENVATGASLPTLRLPSYIMAANQSLMRILKWAALLFLGLGAVVYAGTLLEGTDEPGVTFFLMVLFGGGAWWISRSLRREDEAVSAQAEGQEVLAQLKHATIQLAMEHGGVLTVTDVATDLQVTLEDAEYVLTSLDDGVRVTSTVSEDGVIVYEFKEVIHRQARQKAAAPPARREKRGVR